VNCPEVIYRSSSDATRASELSVLANVYRFILDCHTHKKGGPATAPEDAERSFSGIGATGNSTNSEECTLALFVLRCASTKQRLHWELAGWRGFAHAERLVAGRVVLVMRPGGALGLSSWKCPRTSALRWETVSARRGSSPPPSSWQRSCSPCDGSCADFCPRA
jgi:hypothetical protein